MALDNCRIIPLPKIVDARGNLSFINGEENIPFEIKRVYYLYDVPGGAERGSHAHRKLEQFVIAISGSFDLTLDDGHNKKIFHLNRPSFGLYISSMMWRSLDNFSSGSVCLVLASLPYDEGDYVRSREEFKSLTGGLG